MTRIINCAITFVLMLLVYIFAMPVDAATVYIKQAGTFEQCKSAAGAIKYHCVAGTGCKADTLKCVLPPPTTPVCTPPSVLNAAGDNCITPSPAACPSGQTGTPPNCVPIVVTPPVSGLWCNPDMPLMPCVDLSALPKADVGYSDLRVAPTSKSPSDSAEGGAFRIQCGFAKAGIFDPIVYPNQNNKGHLHYFFGNAGVNPSSTTESLRTSGNSTCTGGIMNRSSYWVPAIIDSANNKPIAPSFVIVYYKERVVVPIPRGLRMISGTMLRTVSVKDNPKQWFECNEIYSHNQDNILPCGKGGVVTMHVEFMNCWDGVNLDSPNHRDHMDFSDYGTCPSTHPKKLPTITMKVYYPVTTDGTANWRLSSDMYAKNGYNAGYSAHADFMMGWDDDFHKIFVEKCINAKKDCDASLLGDGRMYY